MARDSLPSSPKQLRVHLDAHLPIDPLYVRTMSEYDVSLLLYRSWFRYDKGRRSDHGLVKSWSFDPEGGTYKFELEDVFWSNGEPLTSEHMIVNLKRILKSKTTYGRTLKAIVEKKSITKISTKSFSFRTNDKKLSETLLNRFGSVFYSVVYPGDLDETGLRLKSNSVAIGPYVVDQNKPSEITFKLNAKFVGDNDKPPVQVVARPRDPEFNMRRFLEQKTWANYVQTTTLLPLDIADGILQAHLPIWTRSFDRVVLMKPLGQGLRAKRNRAIVKYIGASMAKAPDLKHPLQTAIAKSLQPFRYPLFQEIYFAKAAKPKDTKIRVFTYESPSLEFFKAYLDQFASRIGLTIKWNVVPLSDFGNQDWNTTDSDLVLFGFGVADPEPTTWLSLIFNSGFISFDANDKEKLARLAGVRNSKIQNDRYRKLLTSIAKRGGYLPLFHGATMSIGHLGMNFESVDPLDETVDYSKIRIIE